MGKVINELNDRLATAGLEIEEYEHMNGIIFCEPLELYGNEEQVKKEWQERLLDFPAEVMFFFKNCTFSIMLHLNDFAFNGVRLELIEEEVGTDAFLHYLEFVKDYVTKDKNKIPDAVKLLTENYSVDELVSCESMIDHAKSEINKKDVTYHCESITELD